MIPEKDKRREERSESQVSKNEINANLAEPFKAIRARLLQQNRVEQLTQPDRETNIQQYEQLLLKVINDSSQISEKNYQEFKRLQKILQLTNEDVKEFENTIITSLQKSSVNRNNISPTIKKSRKSKLIVGAFVLGLLALGAGIIRSEGLVDSILSVINFQSDSDSQTLPEFEKNVSLSKTLTDKAAGANALSASSDGNKIAIGANNGQILLFNLKNARTIASFKNAPNSQISAIAIGSKGQKIVSGDTQGIIKVWEVGKEEPIYTFNDHSPSSILSVAIGSNGKKAVSSDIKGNIKIWDLQKGSSIGNAIGHRSGVNSIVISPDGKKIISGSNDMTIRVWNFETGEKIKEMKDDRAVFAVAIGPNGKKIFSGNGEGTIRVWDAETGEEIDTYKRQSKKIGALALDSRNRILVSGSNDRSVFVWNYNARINRQLPENHKFYITSVAIDSDGKTIISSGKSEIKVWQAKK